MQNVKMSNHILQNMMIHTKNTHRDTQFGSHLFIFSVKLDVQCVCVSTHLSLTPFILDWWCLNLTLMGEIFGKSKQITRTHYYYYSFLSSSSVCNSELIKFVCVWEIIWHTCAYVTVCLYIIIIFYRMQSSCVCVVKTADIIIICWSCHR